MGILQVPLEANSGLNDKSFCKALDYLNFPWDNLKFSVLNIFKK